MTLHLRDTPILNFLNECNKTSLEKKILDCGAGGRNPPLAIFYRDGYETHRIEILDSQIGKAEKYAKEHDMDFNIIKGDMRKLPYENESFGFVFSHHTIFHLPKAEIALTLKEMERVLKPGGLIYVNLQSHECIGYGEGEEVREGEFIAEEHGEMVLHSYYDDDEADVYFENYDIIMKRKFNLLIAANWCNNMAMIEYIAKKK
ncbi:MAG: class I SAM-dependent methyltransferase [Candidatus Heimdallarchaeota archaeon]